MKRFNPETKTFKVFNALYNGERLTQADARKRFGIGNLAAEASRIPGWLCCLRQHPQGWQWCHSHRVRDGAAQP